MSRHEQVHEQVRRMTLNECMDMWNKSACDHNCRHMQMRKMSDLEWWNTLSNELGAWDLLNVVLHSYEHFNNSDMYFFYDKDNWQMVSFSTKQDLFEIIGDDFFVETLLNE